MRALVALFLAASFAYAGEVRGTVRDARGGEYLARVRVELDSLAPLKTVSDERGTFAFSGVPDGQYTLRVDTVGYRLVKEPVTVAGPGLLVYDVILSPDTFQRRDSVDVSAGPFEVPGIEAPAALNLTGAELKNLGTVLMDDPIRAVAALPGVASNNDFQSQFTLRAAPFDRIGLYVDGILLHEPFHTIVADESNASLSVLNGETLEDLTLLPMAYPTRYSDRTAGVVDIATREGSRTKPSVRLEAGVASASVLAEGPFANGRGSWLGSVRKSYLEYLVSQATSDTTIAIGFEDAQGKLAYDLTPQHHVSLYILDGSTDLDRSRARDRSGADAIITGMNRSTLAKAGWQYTPSSHFVANAAAAWIRDRYSSLNRYDQPLDEGSYSEWTGFAHATWLWHTSNALETGWSVRRMTDSGYENAYFNNTSGLAITGAHRGTAVHQGGFAQQNWAVFGGSLRGSFGVRFDAHSYYSAAVASPMASLAWRIGSGPELQLAWGQYVQFPDMAVLGSIFGGARLAPERANHYVAALEQHLTTNFRFRLEAWNRDDRDLITRPLFDPRIAGNAAILPYNLRFFNSLRGYSRGVQAMLQRRSANRLSGWIGYTLSYSRQRDGVEGTNFWSPDDQRHIANVYLSYRLRPSLNVSTKYSYASGLPIPGFFQVRNGVFYLADTRNNVRLPAYSRLDLRANKSFTYDRWKLTVYAELINATNHKNYRLVSFDGANRQTGQAYLTIDRVFPILPAGGVTLEF